MLAVELHLLGAVVLVHFQAIREIDPRTRAQTVNFERGAVAERDGVERRARVRAAARARAQLKLQVLAADDPCVGDREFPVEYRLGKPGSPEPCA